MNKKLTPVTEYELRFTEDELTELGLQPNEELAVVLRDGLITLEKKVPLEIDLSGFSKGELITFLVQMSEKDMTMSQYVEFILNDFIENESLYMEKFTSGDVSV